MRIGVKLSACASALTLLFGVSVAQAQEIKLRWGHYLGNSPFLKVEQDFAKAVEDRSKGRVKIEITYAGGLGKGNELLQLTGRGGVDMSAIAPGYYAEQLAFWKAYQIPFVFNSPRQAIDILLKSYKELPAFKAELDKLQVHYLFHQPLGAYYMTGQSDKCDTVEGLKGKKIRSFGSDVPKLHNAIGAVPVTVAPTEVYEALQRGTLDYSFLNPGNILSNRLHEIGKVNCGPVMSIAGHLIIIGQGTWAKLPKDIQDIITEESVKAQAAYLDFVDGNEAKAVEDIKKAGGTFKELSAAELEKWRKAAPDLLEEWVKGHEAKGRGDEAKAIAKRWRELAAAK